MTSRWRRISRIYHDALARDPAARDAFVRDACGSDEALRHEVASLLAQPSAAGVLTENPWTEYDEELSLSGRQLGSYQLRDLIGAGGMGEVYRAHDSKLGRDVAIKILPRAFTRHPERLARFEREGRLLAALNHPHIAAIYGVEESDDLRGIVLELVDGETLAQRLARGRIAIPEVVALARPIADALDAAHEKGIVHRDLKPANVKIRSDGTVKILDFGLAKALDDADPSPSSTTGVSHEGLILGTPAYMSPEQARGKPVDRRADVWAFGCILYEMLTGRPPFAGETSSDTMAAVLQREPDLSALPGGTPAAIRRLVERCLTKDPRSRLRDIGDARLELEAASHASESAAPGDSRPRSAHSAVAWSIAAASVAAVVWLSIDRFGTRPSPSPIGATLERLTYDGGLSMMPALAPGGDLVAYASDRAGRGDLDIWVGQTNGGAPLRLTDDPADDDMPDFSPDGKQIVFRSDRGAGGIYVVSALGGTARPLFPGGQRPRFSPDGSRIAYWTGPRRGIAPRPGAAVYVAGLDGGAPTRLVPDFVAAQDPVWAPDGRSLLILGRQKNEPAGDADDWWWVPLDGRPPTKTSLFATTVLGETVPIQDEGTPALWTGDGVLFAAEGDLWSVPVSAGDGLPMGPATRLTAIAGRAVNPARARDGRIVFAATQTQRAIERAVLDPGRAEAPPQRLHQDNRHVALRPSITPDGTLIAFEQISDDYRQIWTLDARSGRQQMVVQTEPSLRPGATLSPDGAHIVYVAARSTAVEPDGYVVDVAGGVPRVLCQRCMPYGFLSDSRRVIAVWDDRRTIGAIDIRDGSKSDILHDDEGELDRPHVSPDDRWLVFRKTVRGATRSFLVAVKPGVRAPRDTWQEVDDTTDGRPCGWSPDSRTLYLFLDVDRFRCLWGRRIDPRSGKLAGQAFATRHFHVQAGSGPSTSLGNPITADGLLYERTYRTGDLWRLTPVAGAR
jgi:serine/threonine protein kinase/Tol biopolymer transport system component